MRIAGRSEKVEAGLHPHREGVQDGGVDPLGRGRGLGQAHVGGGAEIGVGGAEGEVQVDQGHRAGLGRAPGQDGGELDGQGGGAGAAHRAQHRPATGMSSAGVAGGPVRQHRRGGLGQLRRADRRFQDVGAVELEQSAHQDGGQVSADQEHARRLPPGRQGLDHLAGQLRAGGVRVHQHQVEVRPKGGKGLAAFGPDDLQPGAGQGFFREGLQRGAQDQDLLAPHRGRHGRPSGVTGLSRGLSKACPARI